MAEPDLADLAKWMAEAPSKLAGLDRKGRIAPGMTILDAGCGSGRNLVYLLREGYEVFAADANAREVETVRRMAR